MASSAAMMAQGGTLVLVKLPSRTKAMGKKTKPIAPNSHARPVVHREPTGRQNPAGTR